MQVKLTIGERLKDLRVERKLTLEQLSAEVGISKSALGKYESDKASVFYWSSQMFIRKPGIETCFFLRFYTTAEPGLLKSLMSG